MPGPTEIFRRNLDGIPTVQENNATRLSLGSGRVAMSGVIGHVMYAILGAKAAAHRRSPLEALIGRHWASYLAGAYLGCDIQTMPEAICIDTGKEVGYGTAPLEKSPLTGGKVRPFRLAFEDKPQMIQAAEKANFRHALWQISEAVADLLEQVVRLAPALQQLLGNGPTWAEMTRRWRG
jgi:hypothetical protein